MASVEVDGIIRYLMNSGVAFKVTDIDTPGVHSPTSYHYRGLAVDLAGPTPSQNSPELLRIFAAFVPVQRKLAELIYSGAPYSIKNGTVVTKYAINQHWNHVHIAVPPGTILAEEITLMPDSPDLPNLYGNLAFFAPVFTSDGICMGYYMVSDKGEVHGHGPGAVYHGRSEVIV